jgi:hypothetical protein
VPWFMDIPLGPPTSPRVLETNLIQRRMQGGGIRSNPPFDGPYVLYHLFSFSGIQDKATLFIWVRLCA